MHAWINQQDLFYLFFHNQDGTIRPRNDIASLRSEGGVAVSHPLLQLFYLAMLLDTKKLSTAPSLFSRIFAADSHRLIGDLVALDIGAIIQVWTDGPSGRILLSRRNWQRGLFTINVLHNYGHYEPLSWPFSLNE